jgi:hypothetical protein
MRRVGKMNEDSKTFATVAQAERAGTEVGDSHNLNFVIASDVITGVLNTGKVRFYPIFVLAADQFRFASMLDTLGFQVVG